MNTSLFGSSDGPHAVSHDASPQLAVGSSIHGKYVVHGLLGLGGFAVVYDAEHVGLGRRVAIKVLHLAADTPLALLERFRREARISALAHHRNVLEVYDTGTLPDGSPYLVMERVNGENLSHVLQRGPLSLAAAVEVVRQLLTGLCALEDAGIVHRDIKPDNLMLHDAGDGVPVVKLVDFGISKRIALESAAKLTCHGTLVGTPQYMSPEQIRGQDVDLRTDLYATGAVLYEALSGHAPHESQNFSELVVAVLNAPLRPLRELRANCPLDLERIATKALTRAAALRYATPREMLADLEACARDHDLPSGVEAFAYEDPIDPIWMTPARISFPALSRWWQHGMADMRRPVQLAAGLLLLAAPGAVVQLYHSDVPVRAVASSVLQGNPVTELPVGREVPITWRSPLLGAAQPLSPLASFDDAPPTSSARLEVPASQPSAAVPASEPETRAARRVKKAREEAEVVAPAPVAVASAEPAAQPVAEVAPDPERHSRWERAMDAALASMVRGQLADARAHYEAASKLDRDEADAFRGLALVCARLGQGEPARAALRRYLTLAPGAPDAATLRARVDAVAN
ncbi:MAG: protein kinase [Polyangiales bacterium]